MTWLAHLASASILVTYALMAWRGRIYPFHVANALGAPPLLWVEVSTGAWPVVPLTATFGVLGVVGMVKERGIRSHS